MEYEPVLGSFSALKLSSDMPNLPSTVLLWDRRRMRRLGLGPGSGFRFRSEFGVSVGVSHGTGGARTGKRGLEAG